MSRTRCCSWIISKSLLLLVMPLMALEHSTTATIILRGGADQFLEESHRSLWDALNIVKRASESTHIVAGGGAAEMEVMTHLRGHARTIDGKQQLVMDAFARAFETIPRQLAENAGFDPTDILNKLRQKHFTDPQGGRWFGVDVVNEGICDTYKTNVWEPVASKMNAIILQTLHKHPHSTVVCSLHL